jgi:hypothetical protein
MTLQNVPGGHSVRFRRRLSAGNILVSHTLRGVGASRTTVACLTYV